MELAGHTSDTIIDMESARSEDNLKREENTENVETQRNKYLDYSDVYCVTIHHAELTQSARPSDTHVIEITDGSDVSNTGPPGDCSSSTEDTGEDITKISADVDLTLQQTDSVSRDTYMPREDVFHTSSLTLTIDERNTQITEETQHESSDATSLPSYRSLIESFLGDSPPTYEDVTGVPVHYDEVQVAIEQKIRFGRNSGRNNREITKASRRILILIGVACSLICIVMITIVMIKKSNDDH